MFEQHIITQMIIAIRSQGSWNISKLIGDDIDRELLLAAPSPWDFL